ncbi:MAG: IS110 family transposase [Actinobacteria bacterium]|uniref:Uncharacterized protein n=1 Tax=Nostocoides veronense TaxID=330836 RepID=A0ABN2M1I9_9MICO|nr:IS110 family transposase [Actinomycetota bacterium]
MLATPSGVFGGVDTHADTHTAAALSCTGALLGTATFPATAAGYTELMGWLTGFGPVTRVGVEGTGSYVSLKHLDVPEAGPRLSGKEYKLDVPLKEGISQENAKKINKLIRDEGPKTVKTQVQGDAIRATAKSRDDSISRCASPTTSDPVGGGSLVQNRVPAARWS